MVRMMLTKRIVFTHVLHTYATTTTIGEDFLVGDRVDRFF
jgi:hypothetical protein